MRLISVLANYNSPYLKIDIPVMKFVMISEIQTRILLKDRWMHIKHPPSSPSFSQSFSLHMIAILSPLSIDSRFEMSPGETMAKEQWIFSIIHANPICIRKRRKWGTHGEYEDVGTLPFEAAAAAPEFWTEKFGIFLEQKVNELEPISPTIFLHFRGL